MARKSKKVLFVYLLSIKMAEIWNQNSMQSPPMNTAKVQILISGNYFFTITLKLSVKIFTHGSDVSELGFGFRIVMLRNSRLHDGQGLRHRIMSLNFLLNSVCWISLQTNVNFNDRYIKSSTDL